MLDIRAQLENYDLTRKVYAIRALEVTVRALEQEGQSATPNATAIASLAAATASLLSAIP